MADTINIHTYAKPKETTNVSKTGYGNSVTRIVNNVTNNNAFEPHYLWGQYFDDTKDISGDMTVDGKITVTGNILSNGNIAAGGDITADGITANTSTIDVMDGETINVTSANIGTLISNYIHNTGDLRNDGEITTKDLTVTGTAHFFELIIDKIKASGGAAIFTPADGFKIEDENDIIPVENGYILTWHTTDGNRAIRNMWQVGDQAICRSFNEAQVGTSYSVKNKYYWSLVTDSGTLTAGDSLYDIDGNEVTFDEDRHYIEISCREGTGDDGKAYYDGTVNPERGDEIAMLGYRGTDDANRQSAIYISAYSSMDPDIRAPFIAHYKGIDDFELSSHRKTWFAANSSQITGALKIQTNDGDTDVETLINNNHTYTHTAYCRTEDNSDNSFSRTYFADAVYMGTAYTNTADESELSFEDYAPWVRFRGADGVDGVDGQDGRDGVDGQDGRDGVDGFGISTVQEWYYANSSSSTPTFNETYWTQGTVPSNYNATNKYLWNVEICLYSNNTQSDPTAPQLIGVYGKDGRGIKSITEYYKVSPNISGVLNTDSGWSTSVPTVDETNRYLWNYEVIAYTDNVSPTKTPAVMIGMYAQDGRSISQVNEWYYVTASDSTTPTFNSSTWSENTIPTMSNSYPYLWNVEEIVYTDDTEYTAPALIGYYGSDGRGIQSITEYYKVSTLMEGETNTSLSGWQTTVPTMNETNKYLWNFERITYTDGDYVDTAPALIGVYTIGEDGKYTQFVFKYSETQPATPTGQTIPPSGWVTTLTGSGTSSSSSTSDGELNVQLYSGSYTYTAATSSSTLGYWTSPSTANSGKSIGYFRFALERAGTVSITLTASSEASYDYGVLGLMNDTTTLYNLTASTVKNGDATQITGKVSGTQSQTYTFECEAGTRYDILVGYYKDSSTAANNDYVKVTFASSVSSATPSQDTSLPLWMSFAIVDKGVVSTWSEPIQMSGRDGTDGADGADGRDGRDGTDGTNGRDGTDGADGRDAIAYYLSQSSGTFTYSGSAFSPTTVTLYIVRSDGGTVNCLAPETSNCTVRRSGNTITVTPTSTTSGGYFNIECLNDDNSTWGTLRYSYNLITKSFVSEIVDDQMTNYATKTEVNELGKTVSSNNSWIQQNSEKVESAVTSSDLSGYVKTSDITQLSDSITSTVKSSLTIGGTNLIMNGAFKKDTEYWDNWGSPSSRSIYTDAAGHKWMYIISNNRWQGYQQKHYEDYGVRIDGGKTYTLSFRAKTSSGTTRLQAVFHWWNDTSYWSSYATNAYPQTNKYFDIDTTDKMYSITFTVKQDSNGSSSNDYLYVYNGSSYVSTGKPAQGFMFMIGSANTGSANFYVTDITLTPGDIPQNWIPSAYEQDASISTIEQTANSITASVNDVSARLDNGGLTINGNTTINGQLSINNTDNIGFNVSGDGGNTSILSKSIGSYSQFTSGSSNNVLLIGYDTETYSSGTTSFSSDASNYIGKVPSGTTLVFSSFTVSAKKPNSGTIYNVTSWSATIRVYCDGTQKTSFSRSNSNTGNYSYTTNTTGKYTVSITWSFASNTSGISGMTVESNCAMYVNVPKGTFTLIGYDGIASNLGNGNTVYFGEEGTYIKYGDSNVLKVSTNGIQKYAGTTGNGFVSEWAPITGCAIRKISSGTVALGKTEDCVFITNTSGTVNICLGAVASNAGRRIYVRKTYSGGNYRLYGNSSTSASGKYLLDNTVSLNNTNDLQQYFQYDDCAMRVFICDGVYWYAGYLFN